MLRLSQIRPLILLQLLCALVLATPSGVTQSANVTSESNPTPEMAFDSANKLYEQGKYPEAASAYSQLTQNGHASAPVYFNLGNALFKSGQNGKAIAAYRQAERLSPRDPDIRANLLFARGQTQGPTLSITKWQNWLNRLALNEWALVTTIAFWTFFLLLAAIQIRPSL